MSGTSTAKGHRMSNLGFSSDDSSGSDEGDGGDVPFVSDEEDENEDEDSGSEDSRSSSSSGSSSAGTKRPAKGGATSAKKRRKGSDGQPIIDWTRESDDTFSGEESSAGSSGNGSGSAEESEASQPRTQTGSEAELDEVEDAVREFVRVAAAWAAANGDRVDLAFASDGGWELWLEVELFLALHAADVEVSRQFPYGAASPLKADLLLSQTVIVELKAQTGKETAEQFRRRVAADNAKIDQQAGELPALVVAFAYESTGVAGLASDFTSAGIQAGPLRIFYDTSTLS